VRYTARPLMHVPQRDFILTSPIESSIVKRSVVLNGRKTSVSLETEFWEPLKQLLV
jgi:predicted DNA-binding ribbon-helix-helix protein